MTATPGLDRLFTAITLHWDEGPDGVLAAVRRTLGDSDHHVLTVADDEDLTWSIEHPLDCRIFGLADCPCTEWAARHPRRPGRYVLSPSRDGVECTMLAEGRTPEPRRVGDPLRGHLGHRAR